MEIEGLKFTVFSNISSTFWEKNTEKNLVKTQKTKFVLSQKLNNDGSKRYKKNWSIDKQSVLKSAAESSMTELTTYGRTCWPAARPVAFSGRFGWPGRLKFWRLINWRGAARSSFRAAPFKKRAVAPRPPCMRWLFTTIAKWAKKGENIAINDVFLFLFSMI